MGWQETAPTMMDHTISEPYRLCTDRLTANWGPCQTAAEQHSYYNTISLLVASQDEHALSYKALCPSNFSGYLKRICRIAQNSSTFNKLDYRVLTQLITPSMFTSL